MEVADPELREALRVHDDSPDRLTVPIVDLLATAVGKPRVLLKLPVAGFPRLGAQPSIDEVAEAWQQIAGGAQASPGLPWHWLCLLDDGRAAWIRGTRDEEGWEHEASGKEILPIHSAVAIQPGQTVQITSRPQIGFKPKRFFVSPASAPFFRIERFGVGGTLIELSMRASEFAFDGMELSLPTVHANQDLILILTNTGQEAAPFFASMLGMTMRRTSTLKICVTETIEQALAKIPEEDADARDFLVSQLPSRQRSFLEGVFRSSSVSAK